MSKKIVCIPSHQKTSVTFEYNYPFFIKSITGLHSVKGDIASSKNAFSIGEKYLGTSIPSRNIVINAEMVKDFVNNRDFLYKNFPLREKGTLYYYEGDIKRKIDYIVEDIDIADSGIPRPITISLICHNPYFTDIVESVASVSDITNNFEFPIEFPEEGIEFGSKNTNPLVIINNDSNIESGLKIVFNAMGPVKNPKIININTQETLVIEKELMAGDVITVTTYINNKNIILKSGEDEANINNYLKFGSKFVQVHSGSNVFKITADEGADYLQTNIYYSINYEAV